MSEKTDKALAQTLGIEVKKSEIVEVIPPAPPAPIVESGDDREEDYQLSRNTFRDLIRKGNLAMEDMVSLARESESPRAYEVLATMMKTIADTTKDLYDLQKKTKELKEDKSSKTGPDNINVEKAVFVGSPADLIDQIKAKKNKE
jgi:hypothetical protein